MTDWTAPLSDAIGKKERDEKRNKESKWYCYMHILFFFLKKKMFFFLNALSFALQTQPIFLNRIAKK